MKWPESTPDMGTRVIPQPAPPGRPWRQYAHRDLHNLFIARQLSDRYLLGWCGAQALFCPYYVPLEGRLGADWGVIVNPASTRFGLLTFEHDDCGCPKSEHEDGDGSGRHQGAPNQDGDMWANDWVHECDFMCSNEPCEETAEWGSL